MRDSFQAEVSMYLVSRQRIVRLQKTLAFDVFPRSREFFKVRNAKMGDYVAYQIVQVTHREGLIPEIWIYATSLEDGKTSVAFFEDDEIDEWTESYVTEGWQLCSSKPNRTFNDDGMSIWSKISSDPDAV